MKGRSFGCIVTALMMILTIFAHLAPDAGAIEKPSVPAIPGVTYRSGDWYVNGTQNVSDQKIVLSGNLIINGGGEMNLRNVTLMMNCTYNGEFRIEVRGSMNIADGDDDPSTTDDASNITDSPYDGDNLTSGWDFNYYIRVYNANHFSVKNSIIRQAGWGSGLNQQGLIISYTDGISIQNSTIINCYAGITLTYSDGYRIINNTIRNCYSIGVDMKSWCDHGVIADNLIIWNDFGIYVYARYTEVRGNEIAYNSNVYSSPPITSRHGMSLKMEMSEVYNNTIYSNGEHDWCLNLYLSLCNYVRLHDNYVGSHDPVNPSYSSFYVANSKNIMIDNNTITKNGGHGLYISLSSSYNNIFVVNNMISRNGGVGLYLSGRTDQYTPYYVSGNRIINNRGHGIYMYRSIDHHIRNNSITSNEAGSYGVYAYEVQGGDFSNNTIDAAQHDIYAQSSSGYLTRFEVTNCTFGTYYLGTYLYDPRILVYNYLNVNVTDLKGGVPHSNITVRDKIDSATYTGKTDGYGNLRSIKLEENTIYYKEPGVMGLSTDGPYNISAETYGKISYGDSEPSMDRTAWVKVSFDLDLPPGPAGNLQAYSFGDDINLTWDPSSSSDVDHYLIFRNNSVGGWSLLYNTSSNAATKLVTAYVDPDAASNWYPYTYKVVAVDKAYQRSPGTDPATCGDWVITSTFTLQNMAITMHGNLIVADGGDLTLKNVDLLFQNSFDNENGILVEEGAGLSLLDGDNDPMTQDDRTEINSSDPDNCIFMSVHGDLIMKNSALRDCGDDSFSNSYWTPFLASKVSEADNAGLLGMHVSGDGAIINNNTFGNCFIPVLLAGSENSRVSDNVFDGNYISIHSADGRSNTFERNVLKNNDKIGIFIHDGSNDTVRFNNITNISSPDYGIALYGGLTENVSIYGNELRSCGQGVYVEYSGNDNLIHNNLIEGCIEGVGIRSSARTVSFNNSIIDSSDYGHYIYQSENIMIEDDSLEGSYIGSYMRSTRNILYLNVTNSGSTDYGIYCDSLENAFIVGCNISSSDYGISTSYGQNVDLINSTFEGKVGMTNSGRYGEFNALGSTFRGITGVLLYSQSEISFTNCTFNGTLEDINLSRSNIHLFNPSYNDSRLVIDTYSSISFYWFLDVMVKHWDGSSARNASLTVNELIGTKVYEGNTDEYGRIRGLTLLQRTRFAFSNVSSSPYTLTARLGNHTGTSTLYLTSSMNTTVELVNLDPAAWDVLIDPLYPTTSSDLTLDYTFIDPEGDVENGTMLRWYVDGVHNATYDNMTVINSTHTEKMQTWFCEVVPFDGVSYGQSVKSIPVTIQNTPPVVSDVTITDDAPLSSMDLHVDYSFFDLDGDQETRSLYRWWVNNGSGWAYSGQDSPVLLARYTQKGENWKCIITPGDGAAYGSPVNSTNNVFILNTPPTLDEGLIFITPEEPNSIFDLDVFYAYQDEDGDLEGDTMFEWFVDREGEENYTYSGIDTRVLPGNMTNKGERWFCRITPHDSTEFGTPCNSTGVLIRNTPPSILGNISIYPKNPNGLDDLEADFEYHDPDGDEQTSSVYRWYVDNDGGGFIFSGITHETVFSRYLAKGQLWYCEVTPFDGENFGEAVTSSIIVIDNSPPSGSDLWISPVGAIAGEVLHSEYTFHDKDDDAEKNPIVRWYRNQVHVPDLDDMLTVPANTTLKGEIWHFTIVLTDGQYSSGMLTSTNITIGNRRPEITSGRILPDTPSTSDDLEAVYTFFDPDGDGKVSHEIQWFRNQGEGGEHFAGLDGMDSFDGMFTSLDDMWYYRIRAFDGDDHSEWFQSETALVINNLPEIIERIPLQRTLSIHETGSVDFSVTADDQDGDPITFRWFLGEDLQKEGMNFTFGTDHNSAGAYTIRVDLSDGIEVSGFTWTVWVNDVNRPPVLEIGSPKASNPKVEEGDVLEFIVMGSDPDVDDENRLFIRWFLNGLPVGTSDTKYLFQPDYHSAGDHIITVELHDGECNSSYSWNVTVQDKTQGSGFNEGMFGLSWDVIALIMEILLLTGSLLLAGWGAVMLRRKKGNVQKYLNLIEKIKNSNSSPEDKERRYLLLQKSIKDDLSGGKIPENHYLILEAELESVLGKSRAEEIKDLNLAEDLKKKVYDALEDGFLSDEEIEELELEIGKSPHLSNIDKQILRDKMDKWREEEEEYEDDPDELEGHIDEPEDEPYDDEDEYTVPVDLDDGGFVPGGSTSKIELDDDEDIFEIPMKSPPDDELDEFEEI